VAVPSGDVRTFAPPMSSATVASASDALVMMAKASESSGVQTATNASCGRPSRPYRALRASTVPMPWTWKRTGPLATVGVEDANIAVRDDYQCDEAHGVPTALLDPIRAPHRVDPPPKVNFGAVARRTMVPGTQHAVMALYRSTGEDAIGKYTKRLKQFTGEVLIVWGDS
jgi:hypothetical protein